ncbi:MAG: DUF4258 domain-containing protein [Nanoarchaeota archaeon]
MNLIYSEHAQKRMKERQIKKVWVEECIYIPDYSIKKEKIIESHKKINNQVLRVVWAQECSVRS